MNNERIDVLAVMEEARALAADQRDMHDDNNNTPMADSWESFRADVVAARAAVAELIEGRDKVVALLNIAQSVLAPGGFSRKRLDAMQADMVLRRITEALDILGGAK